MVCPARWGVYVPRRGVQFSTTEATASGCGRSERAEDSSPSPGAKVRTKSSWVAALLIGAAACGPFTTGNSPSDEGATTTTPADGGTAQSDAPQIDGGTSNGNGGPADAGSRQVFIAHDLRVEGLSGDVVYAHRIKAKEVHSDELVMIADSDLPEAGDDDVHGGVISAAEVRVHDVEADWVHAGTLYVRKLETK